MSEIKSKVVWSRNHKRLNYFVVFAFFVVLSYWINVYYFFDCNFGALTKYLSNQSNSMVLSETDGGFIAEGVNGYIKKIKIQYKDPLTENLFITIQTAKGNTDFKDNNISSAILHKGMEEEIFSIDSYAEKLKISFSPDIRANLILKNIEIEKSNTLLCDKIILVRMVLLSLLFIILYLFAQIGPSNFGKLLFRYRFIIGSSIVLLSILLNINGSSLSHWMDYIGLDNKGLVLGRPQVDRSDEWAVFTPMFISQQSNKYNAISQIWRGLPTNMELIYGQPSWGIGSFFRPFFWGALLLGTERGLAFFWSSRLVILFLSSFEFMRLLTKDDRRYSIMGALLISFSPVIQWWFSINSLVEMIIWGQIAIILLQNYLTEIKFYKRCLYVFVAGYCAAAYIMTFYPAWMIPFFYAFLSIGIGIILENRGAAFKFKLRDIIVIFSCVTFWGGIVLLFLYNSREVLNIIANTTYPGKRLLNGGDINISAFFHSWGNLFLPLRSHYAETQIVEPGAATFLDYAPLGFILSGFYLLKSKKKDKILISIIAVEILILTYCVVGFAPILSRITFLGYSAGLRAVVVIGYLNMLLLMRSMILIKDNFNLGGVVSIVMATIIMVMSKQYYLDYLSVIDCLIIFGIAYIICFICFKKYIRPMMIYVSIIYVLLAGCFVNPIQIGTGKVNDNFLSRELLQINKERPGKWAVVGTGFPMGNYPAMLGLPTLNATSCYPANEQWLLLDPKRQFYDIYNRYAHMSVEIVNEGNSPFDLVKGDYITTYTTVDDLKMLGVDYILSAKDLSTFTGEKSGLILLESFYYLKIYRIDNLK